MTKYITNNDTSLHNGLSFWDYCCKYSQAMVVVDTKGTKYWHVEFDAFPITKMERFTVIHYSDHVIPLYKLYVDYAGLPADKVSAVGGGRNLRMCVKKENAFMLAEKLFDLLMILAQIDQEQFDESPFQINKEGKNSEGFNPDNLRASVSTLDDESLKRQYNHLKLDQPHHKKHLSIIEEEMTVRHLKH